MEARTESRFWMTDYEVIPTTTDNTSVFTQCFACSVCNKCSAGREAVLLGERIYCWHCFRGIFAIKCVSCSKTLSGWSNLEFVCYNDGVWHRDCFRCSLCRVSVEEREPVQERGLLYCKPCNEKTKFYLA